MDVRTSDGRQRAVFDHAFDAIVIADDDGRYMDANPAACELFGLQRGELIGRRIEEFAAPEYDYETSWQSFEEDESQTGQFPLRRPDGEVRFVEYAATRNIRPGEHLSILRDMTARVEREREIEAHLKRLDQFAGMVSHDLRNPLNVAMGQLQLYHETGEEARYEATVDALETIEEITGELLTLVRRADGDGDRTEVSLAALASEVWDEIDSRDATLDVVTDRALAANRGQLHLLLSNLFRNAVGHGGFDVTVRVGPLSDGFYVEDTGEGIPAEDREKVLQSGYTTGYDGSGVGLTIVQRIAAAHDWDPSVGESEDGGARFEFRSSAG